jgi:hypothetical protein
MNSEPSLESLLVRGKEGDPDAQFQLGEYYRELNGIGSMEVAAGWFLKAAIQDHAPSQLALALLYLNGQAQEEYEQDARYWLRKAADNGCKESSKLLDQFYSDDEDATDTSSLMVEAEEGNADAQLEIGSMMLFGIGLRRSPGEGLSYIQKAALAGHAEAQVALGYQYLFGENMDRNETEAIKWLWLSAQQDNAEAHYYLAACYSEGWGVAQNDEQAAGHLIKSAGMGNASAKYHLSRFYHEGIGLPANLEQAEAWCRAAALQGHEHARETLKYPPAP